MPSPETPQKKTVFEDLKKPIQDIISLTETIDERYRVKCFEILLHFYLQSSGSTIQPIPEKTFGAPKVEIAEKEPLIPIDVRAFLQQNSVSEELITKLFLIEKGCIRPIYKITTIKKSVAQIQIALLTALENALQKQGNKLEFSMEDIRTRCKDSGIYDGPNFKTHFKNNSKLFKSLDDSEHVELSPEGQTELAETIVTVAK